MLELVERGEDLKLFKKEKVTPYFGGKFIVAGMSHIHDYEELVLDALEVVEFKLSNY